MKSYDFCGRDIRPVIVLVQHRIMLILFVFDMFYMKKQYDGIT
jgi:hypothetical protein